MSDARLAYGLATLADTPGTDGPIVFTAATERLNRRGWQLRHDGWRLDSYQRNPVFLWMHDSARPPIGRVNARLENRQLIAEVVFDPWDEFAQLIEQKYRNGFLHAVSVGFHVQDADGNPLDLWRLNAEQLRDEAFYDLAEISAVPVPADPGAVRRQHADALATLGLELLKLTDRTAATQATPPAGDQSDEQGRVAWLSDERLRQAIAAELERLGITPPTAADTPTPPPESAPVTAAHLDPDAVQQLLAAVSL